VPVMPGAVAVSNADSINSYLTHAVRAPADWHCVLLIQPPSRRRKYRLKRSMSECDGSPCRNSASFSFSDRIDARQT